MAKEQRAFPPWACARARSAASSSEHSEALFLTSSFVFEDARPQAAGSALPGAGEGYVYSRFTNPTVTMMQDRLAALEGGEACVATASGMSAILAASMVLLKAGDHVVCSNAVFGATVQLFATILARFGVETTFVSPTEGARSGSGRCARTRSCFFLETPSNPLGEISDIAALVGGGEEGGRAARRRQLLLHPGAAAAARSSAPTW